MSAKRLATTDLNHDNWDQEDPADSKEMGTFKTAPKEMLEKRVIRTAKRRNQVSSDEPKKNHFSSFGGFNKPPPTSFDFLANLTNGSNSTNGSGTKSDTSVTSSIFSSKPATAPSSGLFGIPSPSKPAFSVSGTSSFASVPNKSDAPSMTFSSSKADSTVSDSPFKIQPVSSSVDSNAKTNTAQVTSTIFGVSSTSPNQKPPVTNSAFKQPASSTSTISQNTASIATQSNTSKDPPIEKEADIEKARNKYYSRLKGLNEAVSSWIVKHVEMTPLCFLSPIFKDYENYLKEIQDEYEAAKAEIEAKLKQQNSEVKPAIDTKDSGTSLFSSKPASLTQDSKTNQPFGTNSNCNTSTATNTGVFGQSSSTPKHQNTNSSLFGKTETSSQDIFGMKPTESTSETLVSPQNKGFSFSAKPAESGSETQVSTPNKGFSFGSTSSPTSAFAANPSSASAPSKGFSFMSSTAATSPNASLFSASGASGTPPKGFSIGMTSSTTSPTNSSTTTGAAPFSFGIGSGTPFSFNSQTQKTSTTTEEKEEEEDQPPKVEFTPVVEENSVFEKKCKIFVKKEGSFADKGVGTLYIKKIEESGKHQLLVRANTNLGTILLNLILSAAVPTQRTGKNNVMLVCIPTPEVKSPTPVLIRVKTSEEADELLDILKKYKS